MTKSHRCIIILISTTVIITFVSAIASNKESVLTAVQLLWVNIIMDTLAVLTLESPLDRTPDTSLALGFMSIPPGVLIPLGARCPGNQWEHLG